MTNQMDFRTHTKYLQFAWSEELTRVREWFVAREENQDWSEGGDSYWIGLPVEQIGCPSLEELSTALSQRDFVADLAIMERGSEEEKEELVLELRDLL